VVSEATGPAGIEVRRYDSLEALGPLGQALDELNRQSRRPTPFATLPYLRTFLANDEYAGTKEVYRPLLLLAFEGGRPIGALAMRRLRGRWLGLPADRLEFLVTHDNERPRMACREADERRCAEAFLRHLLTRERRFSMLEWMEQEATSPLAQAASGASGCYVRTYPNHSNATIECRWASVAEFYRSLSKNYRASTRSQVGRLLSQGRVEFVSSWEPEAAARLLDLHLGVEARSWKGPAAAGISRHPRRVAFFRELCRADQPMRLSVRLLLIDGAPVASEVNAAFGETWYSIEGAYDEDFKDCGPGHLLFLMTMREGLAKGVAAVNLLNNYAYYKRRLGATVTETDAVQVFRPWTPLWAKARLGALRRRILGAKPTQADADHNLEKPRTDEGEAPRAARPDRTALARETAEVLESCAGMIERVDGAALLEITGQRSDGSPKPAERAAKPGRERAPAP